MITSNQNPQKDANDSGYKRAILLSSGVRILVPAHFTSEVIIMDPTNVLSDGRNF
jgi:hypothetical protein